MERINILESENTNLRDRNDELSTEVEELSMKLHNAYIKKYVREKVRYFSESC